jgi:vitamin K-dependent gamma-carboxylase
MQLLTTFLQHFSKQRLASMPERLSRKLFEPVSIMPLALFRLVYGGVLVLFAFRYFYYDRIFRNYIAPKLLFPMVSWLPRLPGDWMYLPFVGLLLGAVGIFLGWRFRVNVWLFCVSWFYIFVIDVSVYNNHYYLILLLAILLGLTDSHRFLSLDARRNPTLRSETVPYWQLFLFQFQVFVLYFYGGLSKLHVKWLDGTIMTSLVSAFVEHRVLGFLALPSVVMLWTYCGLLFDLLVGFFLFWKPTRKWALWSCVGFHLFNEWLLFAPHATRAPIGIFPMMGVALCFVFLDRHALLSFFLRLKRGLDNVLRQMGVLIPVYDRSEMKPLLLPNNSEGRWRPWILAFVGVYMVIQVGLPLRKYMFPDHLWTREGFLFAWTMKMSTYSKRNFIQFTVKDELSGFSWQVDVREHLTYLQYQKICHTPYMAWLYAGYLSDLYAQNKDLQYAWKLRRQTGLPDPQVYVTESGVSLHSFTTQPLISPDVDLAHETYSYWRHNAWILLRE